MDFSPEIGITNFGSLPATLPVGTIAWAGFFVGLVIYIIAALVYHHHWSYYGITLIQKTFAVIVFNVTALALLSMVALAAAALAA